MKKATLFLIILIGVLLVVAGLIYFRYSGKVSNELNKNSNNADIDLNACIYPGVLEEHISVDKTKKEFCCSESVDMQRDNLKIKICYINDEQGHNEDLLYFYFDDSKSDYILEKEIKKENGLLCTYIINLDGSISGRVC